MTTKTKSPRKSKSLSPQQKSWVTRRKMQREADAKKTARKSSRVAKAA
ncbi:MAG: hypothetical protein V4458_06170 [Pseudomonadota bacterium]